MKRTSILLPLMLLLILTQALPAQPPQAHYFKDTRLLDEAALSTATLFPVSDSTLLLLSHQESAFGSRIQERDYQLHLLDTSLNILNHITLPNTRYSVLLAAGNAPTHISLLTTLTGQKSDHIQVLRIGKSTLRVQTTELLQHTFTKRDRSLNWSRTSPDGQYTALVNILYIRSTGEATCTLFMFGPDMNLLWKRNCQIEAISDIFVDNDGTLYIAGLATASQIQLARVTQSTLLQSPVETPVRLSACKILNTASGNLLVAGTTQSDKSTTRRWLSNGIYALAADAGSLSLITFDTLVLTDFQKEILSNSPLEIPQSGFSDLSIIATRHTPWGGVLALQRLATSAYTDNEGATTRTFNRYGILLAGVSPEGRLLWATPIRQSITCNRDGNHLDPILTARNGNLLLLQTESPSAPASYDTLTSMPAHNPIFGLNSTALYLITPRGNVTKTLLQTRRKSHLCPPQFDNLSPSLYLQTLNSRAQIFRLQP